MEILYPDPNKPIRSQDPLIVLAMCIWGEARGEDITGKILVGCTIRNRVMNPGWWGKSYKGVILKPWQFSSFNKDDPNRDKLLHPLDHGTEFEWHSCFYVATGILEDYIEDISGGANHYYDRSIKAPTWAKGKKPSVKHGRIRFFSL